MITYVVFHIGVIVLFFSGTVFPNNTLNVSTNVNPVKEIIYGTEAIVSYQYTGVNYSALYNPHLVRIQGTFNNDNYINNVCIDSSDPNLQDTINYVSQLQLIPKTVSGVAICVAYMVYIADQGWYHSVSLYDITSNNNVIDWSVSIGTAKGIIRYGMTQVSAKPIGIAY